MLEMLSGLFLTWFIYWATHTLADGIEGKE